MKALLIKKHGGYYAGQVLTNVEKGSIPTGVAKFYEDDEPTPMDVVLDNQDAGGDPLAVINDEMNPAGADKVAKEKQEIVRRASEASLPPGGVAAAAAELDRKAGQRRAREADEFAAAQVARSEDADAGGLTEGQKEKSQVGKEHGVKASGAKSSRKKK